MNPDTLRAIGLMTAGMFFFALEDFLIKRLTGEMPQAQILGVLAIGGGAIFAGLCRARGLPLLTRDILHPLVAARCLAETAAAVFIVTSLALVPLSLAAAIMQSAPLLVTFGAAVWLGERVGWRRWSAVLVGLVGILLIVRPGLEGFRPPALLAAGAAVAIAVRDLVSRRIPARVPTLHLSLWAYGGILLGAVILWVRTPGLSVSTGTAWAQMGLTILVGVIGYVSVTAATRIGDVSAVIPFRYTRLVFAMSLGVAFLNERPDGLTLLGAGLVVGAGLYAWLRERLASKGRVR